MKNDYELHLFTWHNELGYPDELYLSGKVWNIDINRARFMGRTIRQCVEFRILKDGVIVENWRLRHGNRGWRKLDIASGEFFICYCDFDVMSSCCVVPV